MENINQLFLSELSDALSSDRKLTSCDREMQNYVDIQKERLNKKGLTLDYDFEPRGHFPDGLQQGWEARDEHYYGKMWQSTRLYRRKLLKGDKVINKKQMKSVIWAIVINYINGGNMEDEIYACPNCGNPEKIKNLTEGCPYCGTRFKMDELYPKVTAYNIVEDFSRDRKEMIRYYLIMAAIIMAVFVVGIPLIGMILFIPFILLMFVTKADTETIVQLIGGAAALWAQGLCTSPILGMITASGILMARLLISAAKSAPLLATFSTHKMFENELKKYGQDYMQNYFMSQTVAKMKSVIYSDNPTELPFYEGGELSEEMKDIVDVFFRGAIAFKSVEVKNDIAYVSADIYTEVLSERNGKASDRERIFHVNMRKNISKKSDLSFSISKFMCPSCGTSFNAYKHKTCPSCGNRYKMEDAEWVIDSVE